jgi:glycosyltransferase involved in cell wall biosynthesis
MKDISIVLCPRENNELFKRVFNQIIIRTRFDLSRIEIIVVDNNTDSSLRDDIEEFLQENDQLCRIKYVENIGHGGNAQAVNKAIEAAESKWFVYVSINDTYIYDPRWLQYLIGNLSDDDYEAGYRIAGTVTAWPDNLSEEQHLHVQGEVFIAFTDYMKHNPYSRDYPLEHCNILHSARCLEQGYQLKHLPRIYSQKGDASKEWHEENRQSKRYLIAHLHGLAQFP